MYHVDITMVVFRDSPSFIMYAVLICVLPVNQRILNLGLKSPFVRFYFNNGLAELVP